MHSCGEERRSYALHALLLATVVCHQLHKSFVGQRMFARRART